MFVREDRLAQNTFSYLRRYLSKNDKVLDVGTGDGLLASLIRKNIGAEVVGIDVIDINRTKSKIIIFDGQNITFKANSFTVSFCSFVLHHSRRPQKLLEEMKRVAKTNIVVFEDTPQTFFDKALGFLHKFSSAVHYQSPRVFLRSDSEWRKLFNDLGLKLNRAVEIKKSRDPFYPISRQMYILKK